MKFKPNEPQPERFRECNFVYTAPKGMEDSCGDLPCYRVAGAAISCWKFSWLDRWRFFWSGRMWFYCLQNSHPPMALAVQKPHIPATATVEVK